jgi:hypothetical protein
MPKSLVQVFSIVLFVLVSAAAFGQKQANIWYFGEGLGLDFNTVPPTPLTNGKVDGPTLGYQFSSEGCSSICDSAGNLLFYTNGQLVWDASHQVMPNGAGLLGYYSSTQSSLIIPQPASDSLFYVFTTDGFQNNLVNGLRYSVVNSCLGNGMGDVISGQKNMLLLAPSAEKLCAVKHANGQDVWIMTHDWGANGFYAYLLTASGIQAPVVSNIGSVHNGNVAGGLGQMKFSHDGNMLALIKGNSSPNLLELFDFDNATGSVSNYKSLSAPTIPYALEFSPDNTRLYTNSLGLYQYDLTAGSAAAISTSKTQITTPVSCAPAGIQLGPDGKIYVNQCNNTIVSIVNPNAIAGSVVIDNNAVVYTAGAQAQFALPSFMAGFAYDNGVAFCTPPCNVNAEFSFSGDTVICSSDTVHLINLSTGSTTYSWFENGVVVSIDSALSLVFSNLGSVAVQMLVGDSVCGDTATQLFEVTQPPSTANAGPDISTCDSAVQLQGVLPLVGTGTWTELSPTGTLNDVNDPQTVAYGLSAVQHIAVFTVQNGVCEPSIDTTVITVYLPIVPVISWSAGVLSASAATSYQWYLNGVDIADSTSSALIPDLNGNYTVVVIDSNGCEATSDVFIVDDVGIREASFGTIALYPNPAQTFVEFNASLLHTRFRIEMYDLAGQLVMSNSSGRAADGSCKISVAHLASGLYFVKIHDHQSVYFGELMVR